MKKHTTLAGNKLAFSKERVTCLSPDDLDKIIGGFQVDTPEHRPTSVATSHLSPPLCGYAPLSRHDLGLPL